MHLVTNNNKIRVIQGKNCGVNAVEFISDEDFTPILDENVSELYLYNEYFYPFVVKFDVNSMNRYHYNSIRVLFEEKNLVDYKELVREEKLKDLLGGDLDSLTH